ncbi:MAG: hypothetical protein ACRDD5_17520 [Silvania sp.]|uniref:hypothetical protein n=1 Tax=Silvania sp. TaxID=3016633 RepID=UPI003EE51802
MTKDNRPIPWPWKATTSVEELLGMPCRIISEEDNLMAFVGNESVLIIVDEQARIVEILLKDPSTAQ